MLQKHIIFVINQLEIVQLLVFMAAILMILLTNVKRGAPNQAILIQQRQLIIM